MLEKEDFGIGYAWHDDKRLLHIDHMRLDESHRGAGHASFILETLVRVAYYEGADYVEVSMGGGEDAEAFLERNGFYVYQKRPYDFKEDDEKAYGVEGAYGVDGVRQV